MELTNMKPQELMQHYRSDIELLVRYLPWLEAKRGQEVSNEYHGANETATSFAFPVYEGTLLNFVKDVQKTSLTDRNYQYVYSTRITTKRRTRSGILRRFCFMRITAQTSYHVRQKRR